jgi:septal ring factor EnvC (AmiA/AmiB activator)
MNSEELNRKMEFIVDQQATFAVNIQKLEESHAKSENRISRLEAAFVTLYNTLSKMAENQQKTDEQLRETRELVHEIGERLNLLILIVEKDISSRNNGQS